MTARENQLRRRLRLWTLLLILGLVFSGVTALPLQAELELMARWLGAGDGTETSSGFVKWIALVRDALRETNTKFPFLAIRPNW